mmetsp:Transcript_5381/g.16957  ORF Transcript_5381/g.16957 Transcript_5381/m.16957 type:complete len:261 (+) Transcript_5381:297-1079(+)
MPSRLARASISSLISAIWSGVRSFSVPAEARASEAFRSKKVLNILATSSACLTSGFSITEIASCSAASLTSSFANSAVTAATASLTSFCETTAATASSLATSASSCLTTSSRMTCFSSMALASCSILSTSARAFKRPGTCAKTSMAFSFAALTSVAALTAPSSCAWCFASMSAPCLSSISATDLFATLYRAPQNSAKHPTSCVSSDKINTSFWMIGIARKIPNGTVSFQSSSPYFASIVGVDNARRPITAKGARLATRHN